MTLDTKVIFTRLKIWKVGEGKLIARRRCCTSGCYPLSGWCTARCSSCCLGGTTRRGCSRRGVGRSGGACAGRISRLRKLWEEDRTVRDRRQGVESGRSIREGEESKKRRGWSKKKRGEEEERRRTNRSRWSIRGGKRECQRSDLGRKGQ
jgi:hypothetical protein